MKISELTPIFIFFILVISNYVIKKIIEFSIYEETSLEKKQLLKNIHQLRKESNHYNTPSLFHKYAKVQRQLAKLEQQLNSLAAKEHGKSMLTQAIHYILPHFFQTLVALFIVYIWWDTPIFHLPPDASFSPIMTFLSLPKWESSAGIIGIVGWMAICQRMNKILF